MPETVRARSMYNPPGNLRACLEHVMSEGNVSIDRWMNIDETCKSRYTALSRMRQLHDMGLLVFDGHDRAKIGPAGITYANLGDGSFLAGILAQSISFFLEIPELCRERPRSIRELLDVAKKQYGMTWKGQRQVYARVCWLAQCGLVRREDSIVHAI